MNTKTELTREQIEALKAAARAATPQDLDTAESVERHEGGYIDCPTCGGDGNVELNADFCNYDGHALGVQFYGIGPEHRAAEAYFRAASPAAILSLIDRLESAEAAASTHPAPSVDAGARPPMVKVPADIIEARAQGRAEALALLLDVDTDTFCGEYIVDGGSLPSGERSEGWDEDKLSELFRADDSAYSLMQSAEDMYWHNVGLRDDAQIVLKQLREQRATLSDKITAAHMGYGSVSVGSCFSPEANAPGIVYMALDEPREIDADTTDVHPVGSPAKNVLACVTFKDAGAIDQTIGILQEIKAKHFDAPPAASGQKLTDAARDVLAERERQVTAEGWTPEHDETHTNNALSLAAACYALHGVAPYTGLGIDVKRTWPLTGWDWSWWKPKDRRRNLTKAGALILAEIERLDRASDSATASDKEGA